MSNYYLYKLYNKMTLPNTIEFTVRNFSDKDKVIEKKIEIFSYRFPDNSIYVGYCTYGLDQRDKDHRKTKCSPIYKNLQDYPDVKPKVEVTTFNKSFREIYAIEREILDKNPNMKILNINLTLLGY